jgi:hypothetical protein
VLVIGLANFLDDAIDDFETASEFFLGIKIIGYCLLVQRRQTNLDFVPQVGLLLLRAPIDQSQTHLDLRLLGASDGGCLVNHLPNDLGRARLREHVQRIDRSHHQFPDLIDLAAIEGIGYFIEQ